MIDDGDVVNDIAAVGVPTIEAVGEVGFSAPQSVAEILDKAVNCVFLLLSVGPA